jgi:hypothetical protein
LDEDPEGGEYQIGVARLDRRQLGAVSVDESVVPRVAGQDPEGMGDTVERAVRGRRTFARRSLRAADEHLAPIGRDLDDFADRGIGELVRLAGEPIGGVDVVVVVAR